MIPVADPGLQPERTAMSWTRTALAMLVCAAASSPPPRLA